MTDPATHTLYVANVDRVSVINIARCTGTDPSGCGNPVATVKAPSAFGLALDSANHTLYITGSGGNTVEMLDISSCNAMHPSGCGPAPLTATVGQLSGLSRRSTRRTDTIYVPNINDGTVSVIDGATCNASTVTGCGKTATVTCGSQATEAAVDDKTHTVYIDNWADGTLSMINTTTCSASDMACSGDTDHGSHWARAVGVGHRSCQRDRVRPGRSIR